MFGRGHDDLPELPQLLSPALARQLLEEKDIDPPYPGVGSPGKTTLFDERKCQHCNGLHTRTCPRVAEIEFHPDGAVKRVVYWAHGWWPEDQVLWLEDVQEAAGESDTG